MSPNVIQLLVLAGIAIFLVLKLKSVLGTREGFEKPTMRTNSDAAQRRAGLEVIDGGLDRDITDHVEEDSRAAEALHAMKLAEPGFSVGEFLGGARGAYEMILMAFERGDMNAIKPFLSDDVFESFASVVDSRADQGLTVEAEFIGVRELSLLDAEFEETSRMGEVKLRFVGEITSVVRNSDDEIVEGKPGEIKRQKDIWTFARKMGSDDPNWQLVATGE